jgi:cytochrome c
MKKLISVKFLFAFFFGACWLGQANASLELATAKNCMACHAIDRKVVGPGYQDVAKKYAGDATAKARLAEKILKGGAGVWGPVPMPANSQVNEAQANQLAAWVLSIK